MKKKGQLMGMPLVLLFALIVAAMILAYGVKVAIDLVGEADYVDMLNTIEDIENNIDTFKNYDEGSAKVFDLSLPSDVEYLCFYDSAQDLDCLADGNSCSDDILDTLDLTLSDSYNVYLYPQGIYDQNRFSIEDFETEDGNPECISNGGQMVITAHKEFVGITYYE